MGVSSLPETVTRQRCGCNLNPGRDTNRQTDAVCIVYQQMQLAQQTSIVIQSQTTLREGKEDIYSVTQT